MDDRPDPRIPSLRPQWISEGAWRAIGVVVALGVMALILGFVLWPMWR
jgi:hypothetical protein